MSAPRVAFNILTLVVVGFVVISTIVSGPAFDERLEDDPLTGLTIADPAVALTFARTRPADGGHLLLITGVAGPGVLEAVALPEPSPPADGDPLLALLSRESSASLRALPAGRERRTVRYEELGLPFDSGGSHIGGGTNYQSHADEVGREDGPFVFPKLSAPTVWDADVPPRTRLDYEAEICAVLLSDYGGDAPPRLGFTVCNDLTDRWDLVRTIDTDGPWGVTGFADGKGGDGMLPVGAFLVLPEDADAFYPDIEFELYVNGRLRQRGSGRQMIRSPRELLDMALADCGEDYFAADRAVSIADCEGIPAGTLVLTGTPEGVIFRLHNLWNPFLYLQPGDEVLTMAGPLGHLRNSVAHK